MNTPYKEVMKGQKCGQFKGVRLRKWGKWVSEVRIPNCRHKIWLGSFHTAEQAARAYDAAVYCLRGSNSKLNFPNCIPVIPCASSLSRHQIQLVANKYAYDQIPSMTIEFDNTNNNNNSNSLMKQEAAASPSSSSFLSEAEALCDTSEVISWEKQKQVEFASSSTLWEWESLFDFELGDSNSNDGRIIGLDKFPAPADAVNGTPSELESDSELEVGLGLGLESTCFDPFHLWTF